MSEIWDDDEDFGTFESADISSPVTSPSKSFSTPSWLMTPQSTQAGLSEQVDDNTKQKVETTLNPETGQQKNEEVELKPTENTLHIEKQEKEKEDRKNDSNPLEEAPKTLANKPENVEFILENKSSGDAGNIKSECENQVEGLQVGDLKKTDLKSKPLLELQKQLDNALLMEQQKSQELDKVRERLASTVEEMKLDQEKRDEQHLRELENLKEKQKVELSTMADNSEKTMKLVTQQYTELCSRVAEEQQLQFEKQLRGITEKFVAIMEQQQKITEERIEEVSAKQAEKFQQNLIESKKELSEFVTSQCDDATERCSRASKEVEDCLKSKVSEALEEQAKLDLESKREAMQDLTKFHKENLEIAFKDERAKHCDVTKKAVEDAMRLVERRMTQEEERNKAARDRHLQAIRMLLTSSQEHLTKILDDSPPSGSVE